MTTFVTPFQLVAHARRISTSTVFRCTWTSGVVCDQTLIMYSTWYSCWFRHDGLKYTHWGRYDTFSRSFFASHVISRPLLEHFVGISWNICEHYEGLYMGIDPRSWLCARTFVNVKTQGTQMMIEHLTVQLGNSFSIIRLSASLGWAQGHSKSTIMK